MPNKCGVANCNGNYNEQNRCRVFKLPKDHDEQQLWVSALPKRSNFEIDPSKFYICERHWPHGYPQQSCPGGQNRPVGPPSIFNVPQSCLPSHQPKPRSTNSEDAQLHYFLQKDKIDNFGDFTPEKDLKKKYNAVIHIRSTDKLVSVIFSADYSRVLLTCVVHNKSTLTAPLTMEIHKDGFKVPLRSVVLPNNGLRHYTQFFEAVNFGMFFSPSLSDRLGAIVAQLEECVNLADDFVSESRLRFVHRQLQLHSAKTFTTTDYCFALECYPHCNYESLRDVLILPSKRKLQTLVAGTNLPTILEKTFSAVKEPQKQSLLLVDEVKIRPRIAFSGGRLSGMADNNPEFKATAMLCIMMRCLHRGPSVMLSVNPVYKLNATYQFSVVKAAATCVEEAGGTVVGSITDNHKINQRYCKLFELKNDYTAVHPLDNDRDWYLLYDTVHLLKCIRNNWLSEACQKTSLDNEIVGDFVDVRTLYNCERDSILRSTPLTLSSVYPSSLQLQNVQHVLRVFNEKVVAALRIRNCLSTAAFIEQVLEWWTVVNVSSKGEERRLNNPSRGVQEKGCTSLDVHLTRFSSALSGMGKARVQCLTHDTRRALIQTTKGQIALCEYLYTCGFKYVLLREIQSDRIEGEFGVYRQATGGNPFMTNSDVVIAYRKRLARFAAVFLNSVGDSSCVPLHDCVGQPTTEDGILVEASIAKVALSPTESNACAYVAGWLEHKCGDDVTFDADDPILEAEGSQFIAEVSRGNLSVPHQSTFELVSMSLCIMKHVKHRMCCRRRLVLMIELVHNCYGIGPESEKVYVRLANVLLRGIHNLDKDVPSDTTIKKARIV